MAHVREMLEAHEEQLEKRLKELRAQIIPLERELADVKRARAALSSGGLAVEQPQLTFNREPKADSHEEMWRRNIILHRHSMPKSPYDNLTIKELVKKALEEQFDQGATASELLQFFKDVWGRSDIPRTSLSPQLSRLRQAGQIRLVGERWMLPPPLRALDNKAATDP